MSEEQQLIEQETLQAAYRLVFDNPNGEVVLRHIAKVSNVGESSFVPGSPDISAFNEGRRHLFLSILRMVNRDAFDLAKQHMERHYR